MIYILFLVCLIAFIIYYLLLIVEHFDNRDYNFYTTITRRIKSIFYSTNAIFADKLYKSIPSNMHWKAYRWSHWDYDPKLNYPYYCNVKSYLNTKKCMPITDKKYCSISNLYKTEDECLVEKHSL